MSNKNKIKVARSVTRGNLPASLDYGELGYIDGDRLIVGKHNGDDFIVNDWNNLKNRPDLSSLVPVMSFTADEAIQAFRVVRIKTTNGHIVRASKNSNATARVVGIAVQSVIQDGTALIQAEGVINNPSWTWTPGSAIYLGNTVGDLTDDISGFADTDARTFIGLAISATEISLNILDPVAIENADSQVPGISQQVRDGVTDEIPSEDAVYDHVESIRSVLNAAIVSNDGELSGLTTRMDDAEQDITDNATEISNLDGRIVDNDTDIQTNATNIGTNATNHSNLQTQVNNLIVQTVTDGDTTHAPSSDAVYDAIDDISLLSLIGKVAGKFYRGTVDPSSTDRLNYDGDLHVRDLHANANSIFIGGNKLSNESGVLTYSDAANINDYEVVVTQLGIEGSKDRTGMRGDLYLLDGDIILNAMQDGLDIVPSQNAEIFVERGTENNTAIRWNENEDIWEATEDGTDYGRIPLLDVNDKLPVEYLPDSIGGALVYQGTWQAASGNWPTDAEIGYYYIITDPGTIDAIDLANGDWIVYNGNYWDKIDNTERVTSVAGKTGVVNLTAADVGLENVSNVQQIGTSGSSIDNGIPVWDGVNGNAMKDSPAKITGDGVLELSGVEPGIEFDRAAGETKSMRWNEDRRTVVFDAPIEAPNISNEVAIASNVRLENDTTFNTTIPDFVTIENAQAVRLDVVISDRFTQNVRYETIQATVGFGNFTWSATQSGPGLGNTDGIEPTMTLDGMNLKLGFEVTGGSWNVVVIANGFPFWGGPGVTYTKGNV